MAPAKFDSEGMRETSDYQVGKMVQRLQAKAPASMAGQTVREVHTFDGIKFVLADDSWLLIRPSGTEPVLRVYAEATSEDMVKELLAAGSVMAGINE